MFDTNRFANMLYFADMLRFARKQAGLTQERLAEIAGCSTDTIRKLDQGRNRTTIETANRLADVLGIPPSPSEERAMWLAAARGRPKRETMSSEDDVPPEPFDDPPPFTVGPPITTPHKFFGRERNLRRIFGVWRKEPLWHISVVGPRRSGKTSFLHYLQHIHASTQVRLGQRQDWLPDSKRYQWAYIDFQLDQFHSQEHVFAHILSRFKLPVAEPCGAAHFNAAIRRLERPSIVLMDELEAALQLPVFDDDFWGNLRALMQYSNGKLVFVTSSKDLPSVVAGKCGLTSPFFNIFGYTAWMKPLEDQEARDLIASSPWPVPEDDALWILEHSYHWPILIQALCNEHLATREDGENDDKWRQRGLEQIKAWKYLWED